MSAGMDVARRGLLAGAVLLPLGGLAAVTAQAAPVSTALAQWRAGRAAIEANTADEVPGELWNPVDDAEEVIVNGGHIGLAAAEAALWIALAHGTMYRADDFAVIRGDVDALRRLRPTFDWQQKTIFAALLALRGERP